MLRELGAQTRTFKTVKGAMLWYRDQVSRRLQMATVMEIGWTPRRPEERNETDATYAAIACCLKGIEHLPWLLLWYETTWGDGTFLAEKAGVSRWVFTRRCRKTERAVREKMENAGLVEER